VHNKNFIESIIYFALLKTFHKKAACFAGGYINQVF